MASKLDSTDLRVLAELDLNARATATEIGRNLGMNNNKVDYHIKNLEKMGVIKKYATMIDVYGLGYLNYGFGLRLQHANRKKEREIMDYLKNSPFTRWCGFAVGRFDIVCALWSKSIDQLAELWKDFKEKYQCYIRKAGTAPLYGFEKCSLPLTRYILKDRARNSVIGAKALPKIDQKDAAILRMLSLDARAPLSKISKEVGLSAGAVRYRIEQLVEKKVITGFRPVVDMTRLGYTSYKIRFRLNSFESKEKLEQYARNKASHITKTICGGDFEMRMYANSHKELLSTIYEIRDEFSDQVEDYDFLEYSEVVKTHFMPNF